MTVVHHQVAIVVVIDYITKDITTVSEGVVVHGCNCVGGFGSGVAGAIRRKWPEVYKMFQENGTGKHLLGDVNIFFGTTYPKLAIVNGYTQIYCGNDGRVYADPEAIESVLEKTCEFADVGHKEVYMPKIGAGLGGLDWETQVRPIVEKVNEKFPDISIHICDI